MYYGDFGKSLHLWISASSCTYKLKAETDLIKNNKPNCSAPIAAYSHRILASYAVFLVYFLASPRGVPHRFSNGSLSTRNDAPNSPGHERPSAPVRNKWEINKIKIKLNKLVILITSRTKASSVCVHATPFVTGKEHIYKCYEKKTSFTYKWQDPG